MNTKVDLARVVAEDSGWTYIPRFRAYYDHNGIMVSPDESHMAQLMELFGWIIPRQNMVDFEVIPADLDVRADAIRKNTPIPHNYNIPFTI